ncbi:helix-turn-helix transcriptional regulator [Paracoccus sediminis]|nr:helix-turn-helix transcriptional regulator [Paracoccus sediminis]SNR48444.1 regulatory protein, luxR family [Paracoccus sediminis]
MDSDIQGLIADIYGTVSHPGQWHSVLGRVALLVGSRRVVLVERDDDDLRIVLPPGYRDDPLGHRGGTDRILFARTAPPGAVASDGRSRVVVRFLRRRGGIDAAAQAGLDVLLPHIARALELGQVVSEVRGIARDLAASLDWLRIGVCVIRPDRAIVAQNAEFRRLAAATGLMLVSPDNRLDMGRARDRAWFRRQLAQPLAVAQDARPACCPADEGMALAIHLAPLQPHDRFGQGRADGFAIYCLDVACQADIDLDAVSERLSLTGSESELVCLLADGLTNRQIAARRHRSVETVNSQVKSLLNKADCGNRTQLIRRVAAIGHRILTHPPNG